MPTQPSCKNATAAELAAGATAAGLAPSSSCSPRTTVWTSIVTKRAGSTLSGAIDDFNKRVDELNKLLAGIMANLKYIQGWWKWLKDHWVDTGGSRGMSPTAHRALGEAVPPIKQANKDAEDMMGALDKLLLNLGTIFMDMRRLSYSGMDINRHQAECIGYDLDDLMGYFRTIMDHSTDEFQRTLTAIQKFLDAIASYRGGTATAKDCGSEWDDYREYD